MFFAYPVCIDLLITFTLFRLDYVVVRPAIVYGVGDRGGLSKYGHTCSDFVVFYFTFFFLTKEKEFP